MSVRYHEVRNIIFTFDAIDVRINYRTTIPIHRKKGTRDKFKGNVCGELN